MEDISIMSTLLSIIPPGESEACLQLLPVDDEIAEDRDIFIIMVETENPHDLVNGTTVVIIYDNDGKRLI